MEEDVVDNTRWRTAKERLAEAEVLRWNGGVYVVLEKIAGQESSLRSEGTTCSVGKSCVRIPQKKKR